MKTDRNEVLAAAAPAVLFAALLVGAAALLAATLEAAERAALWGMMESRIALVFMLWLVASIAAGALARRLWVHFAAAPGRLAEDVQVLLTSDTPRALKSQGSAGSQALAASIQALAQQRDKLRADIAEQVAQASRHIEQERNRLAALMAELTQSVVVCNLDGRVLLFNARARLQFRALALSDRSITERSHSAGVAADQTIGGAEALGLGRSIYGVLDRRLVAHALEAVQQRLQRGAAHPSTQFVTATRGGQLLRIQMAPVRAPEAAGHTSAALSGFVLMLDNITRDLAEDTARDRLLHGLTEGHRSSLGNLQAAVELLDDPTLDDTTRERFMAVVRDEIGAMNRRLNDAAAQGLRSIKARWPLEDMLGADLLNAAARRIEMQLSAKVSVTDGDACTGNSIWLKVDSFSLLQALLHLAGRLADEYEVTRLQLRLAPVDGKAQLDLVWAAQAMSTETVTAWETEPIKTGNEETALTVRDVVERHGGAMWFERARARQEAFFRFLLPLASSAAADAPDLQDSRPEYYDFDLFAASDSHHTLDERRLADLVYTVFDTETTGLQPAEGDEIIQIGATRLVGGRLLRGETFEQLVDPQRSIPAAGIPIHGITPDMVAGKPTIQEVLPAFHAYAQDSVLVAHNAAFDMRFLQLKEAATGVVFDQPVLDTLLLSAVVHPNQASHRLEAIAERFNISVVGRHTALGDALVTAEVFLKLVPLLAEKGIHTLGQARAAAQETYYARIQY
jgi:DNA polymerase-3 subunit epsilon